MLPLPAEPPLLDAPAEALPPEPTGAAPLAPPVPPLPSLAVLQALIASIALKPKITAEQAAKMRIFASINCQELEGG